MNLAIPDKIEEYKNLPFQGIGLMRTEFIFADYVGEHPLYLVKQVKAKNSSTNSLKVSQRLHVQFSHA